MIYVVNQFSLGLIFKTIKDYLLRKNQEKCKNDPDFGEDTMNDNNQIENLKYINYFIKIMRVIIIILNLCFFSGMSWILICKIEHKYMEGEGDNFIKSFGLEDYSPINIGILSTYFMFTTLSAVGFGDFYPRNDLERIIICFVFIIGIRVFGFILGVFLEMIESTKALS